MDQNKEHKSRKKTQSAEQQQSSDSESNSESCCLISKCVRWCCHHCFVQKPDTPEAKPGSRHAPAHSLKKQGSASQKQETEMPVTQQPQKTRTKTSQDVSGEQPTQVADPVSSAEPTPSKPSAGPADKELSAEGQLLNIKPEFVERVSKEILKQLLEALVFDGVFGCMERDDILEENRTRANLARSVIDSVRKKGEKASKMMINHLRTKDPTLSIQLGLLSSPSAPEGTSTQVIQKHATEVVVDKPDQKNTPVFQQHSPATNVTNMGSSSTPVESTGDSFQKSFLDAHNTYRAMHYAPPLTLNSELNAAAQKWAEEMLETNTIGSSDTSDGENTYYSFNTKSLKLTGKEAVDTWYKKDYDFNTPGYQKEAASFTQLVWRDIRELGVGMATDGKRAFVVGHYRPGGNIDSKESFQKNVLPKGSSSKLLTADESFQKVFLDTHNTYRARHYAPPLTLNSELNAAAQKWAEEMLETNTIGSSDTSDGENTYYSFNTKSLKLTGKEAVDTWYKKDYDFNTPGYQKEAASFTQLVWRDIRELGVGMATDGKRAFVVGHYRPGGNIDSKESFQKNVLPKGSSSKLLTADESFQKVFLDTHNTYRARHYAPPLTLNSELNAAAQKWAEEMLETNTIGSSDTSDGENTYYSFNTKSLKLTGKEAVDTWYKKDYDFNTPGYQKEAASFTQLVWRDIRELGVGMATDGKRAFVVGHYRPGGNIDSKESFQKNVLPKGSSSKLLTADESFQKVFLDTHNTYRARHNALPLTLNHELNAAAQRWADHLLETNFLTPSDSDDGELTFSMTSYKSFRPTGKEAVDRWYSNIKNYDFSKPRLCKDAGSFIQMVWRETREVGVGMASDGVRTFVVGHYRPGVQYMNEECFGKNVFPKGQKL